ncbi:hypothetical protein O3P69_000605 [Scylla paramamosain]|uniref:Uncharacterized protein n=1 Tax=Scylla paramamosain TaxID=85552 RepID=A0AAW0USV8_SCYPA
MGRAWGGAKLNLPRNGTAQGEGRAWMGRDEGLDGARAGPGWNEVFQCQAALHPASHQPGHLHLHHFFSFTLTIDIHSLTSALLQVFISSSASPHLHYKLPAVESGTGGHDSACHWRDAAPSPTHSQQNMGGNSRTEHLTFTLCLPILTWSLDSLPHSAPPGHSWPTPGSLQRLFFSTPSPVHWRRDLPRMSVSLDATLTVSPFLDQSFLRSPAHTSTLPLHLTKLSHVTQTHLAVTPSLPVTLEALTTAQGTAGHRQQHHGTVTLKNTLRHYHDGKVSCGHAVVPRPPSRSHSQILPNSSHPCRWVSTVGLKKSMGHRDSLVDCAVWVLQQSRHGRSSLSYCD